MTNPTPLLTVAEDLLVQRLADDVMLIDLKLPASENFQFRAGQYIGNLLADGQGSSMLYLRYKQELEQVLNQALAAV